MRVENSVRNSVFSTICMGLQILIGFIAQRIFIRILNIEYVGVNGLFSNILSMLSIAELGIGTSIIFKLYKPIANNDKEEIKSLVNLYKKAYFAISGVIFITGLALLPFINNFIGDTTLDLNFELVYILFVLQIIASYLFADKRSLLYADQKNYIISLVHIAYFIILNVTQLVFLYFTRDYYLYLFIKIVCALLENIVISFIAEKKYPYIKEKNVMLLKKEDKEDIITRVKAMLAHKVGGIVTTGTDNILISKYIGIYELGVYSNYGLIITSVKMIFFQVLSSVTASVGNLLIENDTEKARDIYDKLNFLNYWISVFASTATFVIMQPFITIWFGKDYLFSEIVLIILVINMYQNMMKATNEIFIDASGMYVETKHIPYIESIVNIVVSILFAKLIGISGIFIGTIISSIPLWIYKYPKFVYKKLLNGKYKNFAKDNLIFMMIFLVIACFSYALSIAINPINIYKKFFVNVAISLIFPNIILYFIYRKSESFKYFIELLKNIISSKKATSKK